jgi:hypothetical protein
MNELAAAHPHYGYCRICALLCGEGFAVNRKNQIERFWRVPRRHFAFSEPAEFSPVCSRATTASSAAPILRVRDVDPWVEPSVHDAGAAVGRSEVHRSSRLDFDRFSDRWRRTSSGTRTACRSSVSPALASDRLRPVHVDHFGLRDRRRSRSSDRKILWLAFPAFETAARVPLVREVMCWGVVALLARPSV